MGSPIKAVVLGSVAGYVATRVMERATTFLYERQSESSRLREEQLRQEMPTTVLVRKAADAAGRRIDDERAGRLGTWVHYGFGASGGPAAAALMATTRLDPMAARMAVGTGMWVLGDEAANPVLGLTPPATDFPLLTHGRAPAGHLVYGAVLGSLLGLGRRVIR